MEVICLASVFVAFVCVCSVASVMSDSFQPHRLQPTRPLCPCDSPSENTEVGCHFLLQRIFPTQGRSNPRLLHWRQILYLLSHLGSLTSLRVSEEPGPEALLFLQSFCRLSLPSPSSKWGVEAGPSIRAVSLRFRGGKWCRGVARCEDAFTLFKGNISLASTMNTEVPHLLPHLKNGVFSPILGVGRAVEKLWTSPCPPVRVH